MGFTTTVIIIPCHIADIIASRIFGTAAMSTSGGIFPLSLGRQTKVLASLRIQTGDESLTVVPGDIFHRSAVTFEVRGVASHHSLPQCLCHFGLTDIIATQRYAVNWLFIAICI